MVFVKTIFNFLALFVHKKLNKIYIFWSMKYLSNKTEFFDTLINFLISDEVYETTSESFLKGSFKTVSEKIGRIFKPKDDDEPYTGFSEVLNNIKQYSLTFLKILEECFPEQNVDCVLLL